MLTRDALLAFAHFICIFALASLLAGELFIVRKTLPNDFVRRLERALQIVLFAFIPLCAAFMARGL